MFRRIEFVHFHFWLKIVLQDPPQSLHRRRKTCVDGVALWVVIYLPSSWKACIVPRAMRKQEEFFHMTSHVEEFFLLPEEAIMVRLHWHTLTSPFQGKFTIFWLEIWSLISFPLFQALLQSTGYSCYELSSIISCIISTKKVKQVRTYRNGGGHSNEKHYLAPSFS